VTISAASRSSWTGYGATAEQIVQTIHAIPQTHPAGPATLAAKIPVRASDLAVGANAIWALQRSEVSGHPSKLIRIDPNTNRQVASIDVGAWPTSVTANEDGVWVANGVQAGFTASFPATNSVMRIDPATNRVVDSIRVSKPQDVALTSKGSALWVTAGDESDGITLITIDAQTNKVAGQARTLPGTAVLAHIAVGEGPPTDRRDVVWVATARASNGGSDRTFLNRLDADGHLRTFEIAGDQGHPLLTVGFGSVWASAGHTLVRFDPVTERVVATI
jgi:hypothetical protein